MSEKDNNSEGQEPRLNRLALRSFLAPAVTLALLICLGGYPVYLMGIHHFGCALTLVAVLGLIFTPLYGIVWAVRALREIKQSAGQFVGRGWAIAGILISLLTWGILAGVPIMQGVSRDIQRGRRLVCGQNLWNLGTALRVYAGDYGKYPTPDKWCDLLMQKAGANEEWFRCPGDRKGPCSYALNRNAEPNSPGEMVLLFEAKPGWNHYGGPEILSKRNHKWEGCMVLFNDWHVKFEKARDPNNFLWQDIKDRAEDERGSSE